MENYEKHQNDNKDPDLEPVYPENSKKGGIQVNADLDYGVLGECQSIILNENKLIFTNKEN